MWTKLKNILYAEFVAGRTWSDVLFLAAGLLLQIMVFCLNPTEPIVMVAGLTGVCSVVLGSQGKISSFVFGMVQVITYMIISYHQHLYAEVGTQIFYFVMMLIGFVSWGKKYKERSSGEAVVTTRHLSLGWMIGIVAMVVVGCYASGWALEQYTDDSQPMLDAFTTGPAIVAQILMILRFRDQWYYWLAIDVLSSIMWWRADNYALMVLYIFWCINCLYGFYKWSHLEKV